MAAPTTAALAAISLNMAESPTAPSPLAASPAPRNGMAGVAAAATAAANRKQSPPHEARETSTFVADEEHVNDYLIVEELGRGSYATVAKVKDRRTGEFYAMKLIDKKFLRRRAGFLRLPNASGTVGPMMRRPPPLSGRASLPGVGPSGSGAATAPFAVADPMDAVRREIAIMKKLDHPNVIRLYEVLDSEESPSLFMVMELAVNGPVMKLHATEPVPPLPLPRALSFFRQLVLGLEYLHAQGIAHRDLKPENLLVSNDGRLLITDFGVSETYSQASDLTAKKAGSPAFMAPEIFLASKDGMGYSAYKADVWAAGVCLYCFVNGQIPFVARLGGPSLEELICTQEPRWDESLDADLLHLLQRLMTKSPPDRITVPAIKEHPWVTERGQHPLRAQEIVRQEVTEDDIRNSISRTSSFRTVLLVKQAIRKLRARAHTGDSRSSMSSLHSSTESLADDPTGSTGSLSARGADVSTPPPS